MMSLYDRARVLRDQYKEDIDYEVKLSVITQILSAMFANNDHLPKVVSFKLDCRIMLKMNKPMCIKEVKIYPYDVVSQVLLDLGLDSFIFDYYSRSSAFTYVVELNFSQQLIESC